MTEEFGRAMVVENAIGPRGTQAAHELLLAGLLVDAVVPTGAEEHRLFQQFPAKHDLRQLAIVLLDHLAATETEEPVVNCVQVETLRLHCHQVLNTSALPLCHHSQ